MRALIERIKSMFGKKVDPTPLVEPKADASSNAVRKPSSTYSKMQTQGPTAKPEDQPAFPMPGSNQDKVSGTYQASKAGAQAANVMKRPSSTYTKLQALSASGTGAAGNEPAQPVKRLDSILDRLDGEE